VAAALARLSARQLDADGGTCPLMILRNGTKKKIDVIVNKI
jgi:hypothetical protein